MSIRIWHQSYTDLSALPGYAGMLGDHAKNVCAPDTSVELHGVTPGTFPKGMAPVEAIKYDWANQLVFVQIVENAMRAEREGYDTMAISCFVDPALEAARSVVDIPIVSSCETALLVASTMGRAFGLLTLDDTMVKAVGRLVSDYGYQDRVTNLVPLDPPLDEFQIDRAFAGSREFVEDFSRQASLLIDAGADFIIPAEGVLNIALVRNEVQEVAGTPVLDSYGSLLAFAEMLVHLRRRTGLAVGRGGAYANPPRRLLQNLRESAIDALSKGQQNVDG